MTKITIDSDCNHQRINHLFQTPLCNQLTRSEKVIAIAFNILTLGLPLAVYHIYHCCFHKVNHNINHENLQDKAAASVRNKIKQEKVLIPPPYSRTGQEALEFARNAIKDHPEIKPISADIKPENPEILVLMALHKNIYLKALEDAIKNNPQDTWTNQEVINSAEACLKISFALSSLSLDDLPAFEKKQSQKGINESFEIILTKQGTLYWKNFFLCLENYHTIRSHAMWMKNPVFGILFPADEMIIDYPYDDNEIPKSHSNLFYEKGTVQNSFRDLYNEYCKRIRHYVNEKELNQIDTRLLKLAQEDHPHKYTKNTA